MEYNEKKDVVQKLQMILGIKCLRGDLLLDLLLEKIKKVKEIFMYEIEKGNEILIPKELS